MKNVKIVGLHVKACGNRDTGGEGDVKTQTEIFTGKEKDCQINNFLDILKGETLKVLRHKYDIKFFS